MKKKISVVIPCFNEEENVVPISEALIKILENQLSNYEYEIVFIDNHSLDNTRRLLRRLCQENAKIKAILNSKNFGQFNSPYYGMCQATGDCVILMSADFQDPVELLPTFIKNWEDGYKIVCGIKTSSKENGIMYFIRSCYYKTIKKMSEVEQIEHFTGFGLYDRKFIEILKKLNDPTPFLRGLVAELGYERKDVEFQQPKRRAGKTHNNWYTLYDAAMLSFTSYTKIGLRLAIFGGFLFSVASILCALIYFGLKLTNWEVYTAGTIPILLAVLVFGSIQIFFTGLLGEYIMSVNARVMKRPLVVEEERINFISSTDKPAEKGTEGFSEK